MLSDEYPTPAQQLIRALLDYRQEFTRPHFSTIERAPPQEDKSTVIDDNQDHFDSFIAKQRESLRRRPSMYMGSVDQTGLYYMVDEILGHTIEHAMAGLCSTVTVTLLPDNKVSIRDDGPGIPIVRDDRSDGWLTEALFIRGDDLFPYDDRLIYRLNGCNFFFLVNMYSQRFTVEIYRDNQLFQQHFERGLPITPFEAVRSLTAEESTGTHITFKPDPELFADSLFDPDMLKQRLQQLSYLLPGVTLVFRDKRHDMATQEIFLSERGVQDYLEALVDGLFLCGPVFSTTRTIPCQQRAVDNPIERRWMTGKPEPVEVACAFQFTTQEQSMLKLFVNTIPLVDNNEIIHSGICLGISRSFNLGDRQLHLKLADGLPRGLYVVVALKRSGQFNGPLAKEMLPYRELEFAVATTVFDAITSAAGIWIARHDTPSVAARISNLIFQV